jgi:hypothetical protein
MMTDHDRQLSANFSSSLGPTPIGVSDRLRVEGDGIGLPFLAILDLPVNEGVVGESRSNFDLGLVGGVIEAVEGRS